VYIENIIDKTAVREKESVHFAFPYAIPHAVNRFNTGWGGVFGRGDLQLAGANEDYYSVQRWCDVSGDRIGFTLLLKEACLIEPGSMTNENIGRSGVKEWKAKADTSAVLYSYVMNNYWFTNFKSDQEGIVAFRYGIVPHTAFDQSEAEKEGLAFSRPMIAVPAIGKTAHASLFTISNAKVLVTSIRQDNGKFYLRLFNASTTEESFKIIWGKLKPTSIRIIINTELSVEAAPGETYTLPAAGIMEMVVEMQ
jgi:alpha-mannosidase